MCPDHSLSSTRHIRVVHAHVKKQPRHGSSVQPKGCVVLAFLVAAKMPDTSNFKEEGGGVILVSNFKCTVHHGEVTETGAGSHGSHCIYSLSRGF